MDHKRARFASYTPTKGQQKEPEYEQNYGLSFEPKSPAHKTV